MAKEQMDSADLLFALEQACLDLMKQKERLRELDAAIGDGDLGVTVELGCQSLVTGLAALKEADIGAILTRSGMNFTRAATSTFGILFATLLMQAGKAAVGLRSVGLPELVQMAQGAEQGLRNRGNAEVGDKTMLDAVAPAVRALREASAQGKTLVEALDTAVKAAEAGVKATIPLKAKHGRAAWQGERTVGVQDGGATAVYLFAEALVGHLKGRLA
jgi:dihydroxyacetone kinase-like protein